MLRRLTPLVLALLLAACAPRGATPAPPATSGGGNASGSGATAEQTVRQAHLDEALRQLQAITAAAARKDFSAVRGGVEAYSLEFTELRPAVAKADPALDNILLQALQEMQGELARHEPQAWEFDEEATKIARLWAQLAPRLGVRADPTLLPPADKVSLPPSRGEVEQPVTLQDYSFTPETITVRQHTKVTLQVTNKAAQPHEMVIDGYGEVEVPPGAVKEFVFVAERAGTFEFACHLPGHYEAGMKGTLVVQPAA